MNLPNPPDPALRVAIAALHAARGFFQPTASASFTTRSQAHHVRRPAPIPARTASPCPIRPLKKSLFPSPPARWSLSPRRRGGRCREAACPRESGGQRGVRHPQTGQTTLTNANHPDQRVPQPQQEIRNSHRSEKTAANHHALCCSGRPESFALFERHRHDAVRVDTKSNPPLLCLQIARPVSAGPVGCASRMSGAT